MTGNNYIFLVLSNYINSRGKTYRKPNEFTKASAYKSTITVTRMCIRFSRIKIILICIPVNMAYNNLFSNCCNLFPLKRCRAEAITNNQTLYELIIKNLRGLNESRN